MKTTSYSTAEAAELYGIPSWSGGWFRVNDKGHVDATPAPGLHATLRDVIDELVQERGESLPVILRFPQILAGRVRQLNDAFRNAIQ